MEELAFEWDEAKADANLARHGVHFEQAQAAFDDPFAIEFFDDRGCYGEERFILIGMTEGRLLTVVCTMRQESFRLISARQAAAPERRRYHETET